MNAPRIGSLFSGYGGLDTAVADVFGGSLAWYADVCKFDKADNAGHHEPHRAPCSIMAHHHPDVPNLGDVSAVDWSTVEPVDILTGGSPCQDLSHAGKRAGMTEGTRSNLWVAMREAIAQLRPRLIVWENVRGAASAEATSDLEHCPGCMGDPGDRGTVLRALGRVVGDLADLGYVGQVRGLRAADVGAPHGRFRYFLAAHPEGDTGWLAHGDGGAATDADGGLNLASGARADQRAVPPAEAGRASAALLPTPSCSDTNGAGQHGDGGLDLRTAVSLFGTPTARMWKGSGPVGSDSHQWLLDHGNVEAQVLLLPTPAVNDMGEGKTVERWDDWTADMQTKHGNGNGHGKSLAIEAQRLLPTPNAADAWVPMEATENTMRRGDPNGSLRSTSGSLPKDLGLALDGDRWGIYAAAIARWEHILGRPAPAPTQTSSKGNPQLSPAFVEWMMGLPEGWVTDVPGITRNEALKALGNGVVPQQAAHALRTMLAWEAVA